MAGEKRGLEKGRRAVYPASGFLGEETAPKPLSKKRQKAAEKAAEKAAAVNESMKLKKEKKS